MIRLFQKKISPKSLSTREIHNLYLTLQSGLSKSKDLLIDEIDSILDGISEFQFKKALKIMYGEIDATKNPLELLLLFTRGIKKNNLIAYSDFMQGINGRSK